MMDIQQYLAMRNDAFANDGIAPSSEPYAAYDLTLFDPNKNTDWFKQLYGGVANNTIAHASLSGGTATTTFIVSGGDSHQTYNFPGGYAEDTYTLHTGFHHNSPDHKLTIDFGTDYSYDQNNSSGAPSVLEAYTLPPNYPNLFDASGNLVWNYKGLDLGGVYPGNPLAYLKQTADMQSFNLNNHLSINYQVLPGLILGSSFGYSRYTNQEDGQRPLAAQDPADNPVASASFNTLTDQTLDITPLLTYAKKISKGKLSAQLGGEFKDVTSLSTSVSGSDYSNDALLGSIDDAGNINASDTYSQYKYAAVFARLGYIWDSKYILSLSGRRDGSSNFGPGRQIGNFGSAGAGWIFTEEPVFKTVIPVLSYGKVAVNYGTTGSDGIQPYQYQSNWVSEGSSQSYQGIVPYRPVNLYNPDYSWSTQKKINLNLSLGFLKDRLLVDVNLYQNRSSNQLISATLPGQDGITSVVENQPATVQDRGWEISVSSINIKTKNFSWSSNINISGNQNKLIAFPNLANSSYAGQYAIGQPTSVIYGWQYLGVNPTTGIFQYRSANGTPTSNPTPGPVGNGNGGDEVPIGNTLPKFQGGFGNTFNYKNFSLMVFFQFSDQNGLNYIGAIYSNGIPGGESNLPVQVMNNIWQKPGDVAKFEILTTGNNYNAYNAASDFYSSSGAYSNASYIRLKTLSLSWKIPEQAAKKIGLHSASIYINAQNLFTITSYQVLDPEAAGQIYSFPLQKTIVAGLSLNL